MTKYKAKPIPERAIQKACIQYLLILENQGKLWFVRCGSGAIKTKEGRYFKSGKKGAPDIICCIPNHDKNNWCGLLVGIEIKSKNGNITEEQMITGELIESLGGKYEVVRSLDELIIVLETFGINTNTSRSLGL